MESTEIPILLTSEQTAHYHTWWNTLSDSWKRTFNEVMLRRSSIEIPDDQTLYSLHHLEAIRLAGPTAPFPSMSFELEDLSGLRELPSLKIVIVGFHKLTNFREISHMVQINSLFLFNNQITSLEGIEGLENLTEFYFNVNQVSSLKPLTNMTKLHTLYCNFNTISSLEGIGTQHRSTLKKFVCLPNDHLPDEEIIRMEREIGIRCIKG